MSRLLTFYGDDFTGSTDVMEALASHGVSTVLFTRFPTEEEFALFGNYEAIGLAGTSRSQSPQWMDEHLPHAFGWLKSLAPRFCHYKVCSTFDSSPSVGSIGRAADIGAKMFNQAVVPVIVGAPQLKRYTFAGHLFAGYQGETYRIDRHPVMSRHPVTPMEESDLRRHLAKQTAQEIVLATQGWPARGIGLLDVHDAATQFEAGRRLLDLPDHAKPFMIGSSGVEYALLAAMKAIGDIAGIAKFEPLKAFVQTIVVSGSVSPTTERQIRFALQHGFQSVPIDPVALAGGVAEVLQVAIQDAQQILNAGKSPIIHTALGPASDEGEKLSVMADGRRRIGEGLGRILKAVIETSRLARVILAGGDSSSHALGQLNIHALTTRMPLPATPGSPLCIAHSNGKFLDGVEIALKGGQVGADDYFVKLRDGTP
jgi:uncharacterized protein YgbK (DUF1537 family)